MKVHYSNYVTVGEVFHNNEGKVYITSRPTKDGNGKLYFRISDVDLLEHHNSSNPYHDAERHAVEVQWFLDGKLVKSMNVINNPNVDVMEKISLDIGTEDAGKTAKVKVTYIDESRQISKVESLGHVIDGSDLAAPAMVKIGEENDEGKHYLTVDDTFMTDIDYMVVTWYRDGKEVKKVIHQRRPSWSTDKHRADYELTEADYGHHISLKVENSPYNNEYPHTNIILMSEEVSIGEDGTISNNMIGGSRYGWRSANDGNEVGAPHGGDMEQNPIETHGGHADDEITVDGHGKLIAGEEVLDFSKLAGPNGPASAHARDFVDHRAEFTDGDDSFVVTGSFLNSVVNMGAGDDKVKIAGSFKGFVDGGEGLDVLELSADAMANGLEGFTGFERIVLDTSANSPAGKDILSLDDRDVESNHDADGILRIEGSGENGAKVEFKNGDAVREIERFTENGEDKVKLSYDVDNQGYTIIMDSSLYQNGSGII